MIILANQRLERQFGALSIAIDRVDLLALIESTTSALSLVERLRWSLPEEYIARELPIHPIKARNCVNFDESLGAIVRHLDATTCIPSCIVNLKRFTSSCFSK